jgi:hypothetical protein
MNALKGPLTGLSFRHAGRGKHLTHIPSNEERLRAFRQAIPANTGNVWPWAYTQKTETEQTKEAK